MTALWIKQAAKLAELRAVCCEKSLKKISAHGHATGVAGSPGQALEGGNDPPQYGHGVLALCVPGMAIVQAGAIIEAPGGGEDRPRCQADALSQSQLEQAQRINLFGKLEPEEVTAAGAGDLGAGGKMPRRRGEHRRLLRLQGMAQLAQVTVIAAVLQVIGQGGLSWYGGGEGGHQLEPADLLGIAPAGHPADPVTRC